MAHDPFAAAGPDIRERIARPVTAGRMTLLRTFFRTLLEWQERRRSRIRLAELPPHLLRDVGIAPDDARLEASKPFWEK